MILTKVEIRCFPFFRTRCFNDVGWIDDGRSAPVTHRDQGGLCHPWLKEPQKTFGAMPIPNDVSQTGGWKPAPSWFTAWADEIEKQAGYGSSNQTRWMIPDPENGSLPHPDFT